MVIFWSSIIVNEHFEKEIEWRNKLIKKYKCDFVSGEHDIMIWGIGMNVDIFGRKGDDIYIVEIGSVQGRKLKWLKKYTEFNNKCHFIHVKLIKNHARGD